MNKNVEVGMTEKVNFYHLLTSSSIIVLCYVILSHVTDKAIKVLMMYLLRKSEERVLFNNFRLYAKR